MKAVNRRKNVSNLVRVLCLLFILLQSDNGILIGGAFVQQRPDAGPTFQILARLWPGLGECPVLLINHLISISLLLTNHLIPVHYVYMCIIMFKLIYKPQVGLGA